MVNKSNSKLIWITALGGLLEYYDFSVFALMAGYLAEQFFPGTDPLTSLLTTFATFSVGYFSRPLGGLVFGHFGDRYGRKKTFSVSVLIMAVSTALMGCLPTYAQIGIWAPVMMTLLRMAQGFSIGGEIPGAITFLSESSQKYQGLILGLLISGLLSGFIFGSFVHSLLLQLLGSDAMKVWGWRIPFWLGGGLGIFSYFIRKHINESALFLKLNREKQQQQVPALELLKHHKRSIITGVLLIIPATGCMSLLFLFIQSYLTQLLHYKSSTVTAASIAGTLMSIATCIFTGGLADRNLHTHHAIKLMRCFCLLVIPLSLAIFHIYVNQLPLFTAILISGLAYGSVAVIGPLLLSTTFPVSIRYSGVALSYNICLATFGGLTPVIAMALIQMTGNHSAPALYLVFCSICGLAGCYLLRKAPLSVAPQHNNTV
ncbi:MFS transporter [Endozoicomonas atrinae]|uniref:MFS transporter n=1 Tax=Endozoicomonas atrinae TaxID=1333660 RepID=UPI0009F72735|nr:MFS transporter [Endozoicomonas atrinae]